MKNLKKVLALVVACVMLFTMSSFAFTDVESDASYIEAVTLLNKLGIITGYEDGSFLPNNTITRAEAATVLVRALNGVEEAKGMAASNMFTDVPASHWAAGYVNYAATYGIVNGRGAGIFDPEAPVAYEEIVKMIVAMLGWTPAAEEKGGYPTGYLYAANKLIKGADKIALTKGASGSAGQPAARWIVAKLLFNALEAKFMDKDSFGSKDAEYKAIDMTLLVDYLELSKVEGVVTGTFITEGFTDKEELSIKIGAKSYEGAVESDANLLGYYVTAYINEDDELVAAAPKAGVNEVLVLDYALLAEVAEGEDEGTFTYYDANDKEVEVEAEADVIEAILAIDADKDGFVTLIKNDEDAEGFNVIFTEETEDKGVVEEIEAKISRVVYEEGGKDKFDADDEDAFVMFIKNGELVDFDAIAEGDVISVAEVSDVLTKVYISDAKVEGTVSSVKDGKAKINGVEYVYTCELAKRDAGVFFLNYAGKIVAKDTEEDVNGAYAFIIKTINENVDDEYYIPGLMFVNAKGEKVEAYFANTVTITVNGEATKLSKMDDEELVAELASAIDLFGGEAGEKLAYEATDNRLVEIELNAEGKIKALTYSTLAELDEEFFSGVDFTEEYDEDKEAFENKYAADENTVIFQLNGVDTLEEVKKATDITVVTGATFKDGVEYVGYAYDADDYVYGAMIITNDAYAMEATAPLFVVESIEVEGDEDEEYLVITGYMNGEKTTVETVEGDEDIDLELDLAKGSVIELAFNAAGKVKQIDVIVDLANETVEGDNIVAGYVYEVAKKGAKLATLVDEIVYEDGELVEATGEDVPTTGKMFVGNIYGVELSERNAKYNKIDADASVVAVDEYAEEGDEIDMYYAVAKVVDEEVIDIVVFTWVVEL